MTNESQTPPRFFSAYANNAFQVKRESNAQREATICVEAAPMLNGEANWERKIHFQLKPNDELVSFCALMIGLVDTLKFENHGPDRNKSLQITRNQNSSLYLSLNEGGNASYNIVLKPESAWLLGTLGINQLRHRLSLSFGEATSMLRLIKYDRSGEVKGSDESQ